MSEITRRDALNRLAAAFAAAGLVDRIAAREVHAAVAQAGAAGPKSLTTAQFRTLERVTDLIIPADQGRPGAVEAGVPGWIGALLDVNAELEATYAAGLGWLDRTMTARHGTTFVSATAAQQTALFDEIAFQKNRTADNAAGVEFFVLARRMTVDGFYTSPAGIREIIPQ